MPVDEEVVRRIAKDTRAHTFEALTMDEHTNLVRTVLTLTGRAALPQPDDEYAARELLSDWKGDPEDREDLIRDIALAFEAVRNAAMVRSALPQEGEVVAFEDRLRTLVPGFRLDWSGLRNRFEEALLRLEKLDTYDMRSAHLDELARVFEGAVSAALAAQPQGVPEGWSDARTSPGPVNCNVVRQAKGLAYPRTCERCGLGPCPFFDKNGRSPASPKPSDESPNDSSGSGE